MKLLVVEGLAVRKACTYIDVHSQLVLNEELADSYGVHLSGEAYLA